MATILVTWTHLPTPEHCKVGRSFSCLTSKKIHESHRMEHVQVSSCSTSLLSQLSELSAHEVRLTHSACITYCISHRALYLYLTMTRNSLRPVPARRSYRARASTSTSSDTTTEDTSSVSGADPTDWVTPPLPCLRCFRRIVGCVISLECLSESAVR